MNTFFDLQSPQAAFDIQYAAELNRACLPTFPADVQLELHPGASTICEVLRHYLKRLDPQLLSNQQAKSTIAIIDASYGPGHHIPPEVMRNGMLRRFSETIQKLAQKEDAKVVIITDAQETSANTVDTILKRLKALDQAKLRGAIILEVPALVSSWHPTEFDLVASEHDNPLLRWAAQIYYGKSMHPVDVAQAAIRACVTLPRLRVSDTWIVPLGAIPDGSTWDSSETSARADQARYAREFPTMDKIREKLNLADYVLPHYPDISRARELLGYEPIYSVERVLREACAIKGTD